MATHSTGLQKRLSTHTPWVMNHIPPHVLQWIKANNAITSKNVLAAKTTTTKTRVLSWFLKEWSLSKSGDEAGMRAVVILPWDATWMTDPMLCSSGEKGLISSALSLPSDLPSINPPYTSRTPSAPRGTIRTHKESLWIWLNSYRPVESNFSRKPIKWPS